MGTKTISLKVEAYNRLRGARRYSDESFSAVVLRATWPEDTVTAGAFLRVLRAEGARLSEDELHEIEQLKRLDHPPGDKWAAH